MTATKAMVVNPAAKNQAGSCPLRRLANVGFFLRFLWVEKLSK
jgi:hypothetical protein